MAGPDPMGANLGSRHPLLSSWPGLTRPSVEAGAAIDDRVKPGHDARIGVLAPTLAPMGSGPAMTNGCTASQRFWVPGLPAAAPDFSPVIIGGNDWASAWAVDAQGRNPYAVIPGGQRQRTLAYRFGVNLVMYALTGNYKGDQVHIPAILQRLGQ